MDDDGQRDRVGEVAETVDPVQERISVSADADGCVDHRLCLVAAPDLRVFDDCLLFSHDEDGLPRCEGGELSGEALRGRRPAQPA